MNIQGLALCSRFSYPPNSLSLCGPQKQKDLEWYTSQQIPDAGTQEILTQFSTLYPYLSFIAYENNIRDSFDTRVVEAYWIGNSLLSGISKRKLSYHLTDTLELKRKSSRKNVSSLLEKIPLGAIPFHAFHVLNVYKRTGHTASLHTIQSMDACIINFGRITKISKNNITVRTRPLALKEDKLGFGEIRTRNLLKQGQKDSLFSSLQLGDWVSYHWGYFCQKLSVIQLRNLQYFTDHSIQLANTRI